MKLCLALCLSFIFSTTLRAEMLLTKDCDANGTPLKDFKELDPQKCFDACKKEATCDGFTHISNWNRCFLKQKTTRSANVKMYSGEIVTEAGVRKVGEQGANLDHKGKDWQKKIFKTFEPCREECLAKKECHGFTFIGGYDICWLKNTQGKLVAKTFSCGVKDPSSS